ncbi:SDR family NAD(P)-dependent oxidoreductase [Streptosporangium sp. NPDC087985]|uniref:SDR family NAD(P)-dependent oxidoreductase n=1 Tax=Streptosporangium sp. NPDC087985 TaxID=3366196 RepID=UPI00382D9BFD
MRREIEDSIRYANIAIIEGRRRPLGTVCLHGILYQLPADLKGPLIVTTSIIVGGSSGLGRAVAQRFADRGDTVIITSRTTAHADTVATEIGGTTRGLAVDLSRPETIAAALVDVREVDNLVISAIAQGVNSLADFDIAEAIKAVTIKLVGYTETVRALRDRFTPGASVVLFGGLAKERPYPGSTMVTAFNGGITGLVKTLAVEIAPHRVNAIHPGVVGDSPKWRDVPDHPHVPRTPIGRLVTTAEVVDATEFLLRNTGVNAHDLFVDGGLRVT